ncbi:MAG: hypothetical protein EHM78_06170 [Myxococcaceae bacterium]|nr:MAG: hypothetical protein EHM78_06170 [Myxococcaceae bacterium]
MNRLLEPIRVGFGEWRTVAVLLWANWLVAGLMVAPTVPTVWAAFGHAPLAVGKPLVSSELLIGLRPLFVGGGTPSVGAPLLLLVVLQTFLVGGVVWRASAGGPFRLGAFLGQSGRLVGRNARLYLWLLLLLGVAMLVPVGLAALLHVLGLRTIFTMPGETWIFGSPFGVTSVLHLAVLGVALALWRLSLEVGRVLIFRDDLRTTRRAAWRALRLVLRSPLSIVLYAVLGAVATGAALLLMRGRAMLPEGNAGLALLALGVGQTVLWTRLAFQVAGTRFAAALVQRTDAAPRHVGHLEEPVEAAPPV